MGPTTESFAAITTEHSKHYSGDDYANDDDDTRMSNIITLANDDAKRYG